jgi:GT2 family glycosyltransferase
VRLSLVIVTWNSRGEIESSLAAAGAIRNASPDTDIVLVDNASEDGTTALVEALAVPGVHLVAEPVNRGFAGGMNVGARHAQGDALLLLNPDARPSPAAVVRMVATLSDDERIAAVAPVLVDAHGVPQRGFTVRRFPTAATLAADLLLLDVANPRLRALARYRYDDLDLDQDTQVDVEQPAAACLLVRRAAFDAAGGFDERFHPAWFEDVDLCRRWRDMGWRVVLERRARVPHEGGMAWRRLGDARAARVFNANLLRYAARHLGTRSLWALRPAVAAGMGMRAAAAAVRGRPREAADFLRAVAASWAGVPDRPGRPIR